MKKRLSYSHTERHNEWLADGGLTSKDHQPELNELKKLCAELIGIDSPAQIADRNIGISQLENSPELYGRTLRQTRQKYAGDVHSFKPSKGSVDIELSEVESVLVSSAGHTVELNGAGEIKE